MQLLPLPRLCTFDKVRLLMLVIAQMTGSVSAEWHQENKNRMTLITWRGSVRE